MLSLIVWKDRTDFGCTKKLMSSGIPCLILCRGHEADDDLIEAGRKYNVPVLMTEWTTSRFDAELTRMA